MVDDSDVPELVWVGQVLAVPGEKEVAFVVGSQRQVSDGRRSLLRVILRVQMPQLTQYSDGSASAVR